MPYSDQRLLSRKYEPRGLETLGEDIAEGTAEQSQSGRETRLGQVTRIQGIAGCHDGGMRSLPAAHLLHLRRTPAQSLISYRPMSLLPTEDAPLVTVTTHNTYNSSSLSPSGVSPSPLDQFRKWFKEAQDDPSVVEPEAMSLSTATKAGVPSSRIVLLKQVDDKGFVLYTNYTSRKSNELKENPHAALAFYWKEVHRQVRVVGRAEMVDRRESEEYFRSRPVGSRVGAWASRQSTVVGETEVHDRFVALEAKFNVVGSVDGDVPLPNFWGGWRIIPE